MKKEAKNSIKSRIFSHKKKSEEAEKNKNIINDKITNNKKTPIANDQTYTVNVNSCSSENKKNNKERESQKIYNKKTKEIKIENQKYSIFPYDKLVDFSESINGFVDVTDKLAIEGDNKDENIDDFLDQDEFKISSNNNINNINEVNKFSNTEIISPYQKNNFNNKVSFNIKNNKINRRNSEFVSKKMGKSYSFNKINSELSKTFHSENSPKKKAIKHSGSVISYSPSRNVMKNNYLSHDEHKNSMIVPQTFFQNFNRELKRKQTQLYKFSSDDLFSNFNKEILQNKINKRYEKMNEKEKKIGLIRKKLYSNSNPNFISSEKNQNQLPSLENNFSSIAKESEISKSNHINNEQSIKYSSKYIYSITDKYFCFSN